MNAPGLNAMTDCPEHEDLAAFHDGRLTEEDRARVLEHVASCGMCQDILVELDAYAVEEKPAGKVVRGRFGGAWLPAAAVAAVLVITFGALFRERLFAPRDPMREVAEASETLTKRPIDARLSGPFPYRESKRTFRGDTTSATEVPIEDLVERADLYELAQRLMDEPLSEPIEQAHTLGVAHLLIGDRAEALQHLQQAVDLARRARIEPSKKAAILNDYAAARYQHSRYHKDDSLKIALNAVQEAWALDQTPAIAWTRALILQETGATEKARKAWQEYLKLDSSSEWAKEVQQKLAPDPTGPSALFTDELKFRLLADAVRGDVARATKTVAKFPREGRLLGEGELLRWADATRAGRTEERERAFTTVRTLSRGLQAFSGESLLSDTVASVESGIADHQRLIAESVLLLRSGKNEEQKLETMERRLRVMKNPFAVTVALRLASLRFADGRVDDAVATLNRAGDLCAPHERYFAACGSKRWLEGLAASRRGRLAESTVKYDLAISAFTRLREHDNTATVLLLRAEALDSMRASAEASRERIKALRLVTGNPAALGRVHMAIGLSALRDGEFYGAEALFASAMENARARNDRALLANASRWQLVAQSQTTMRRHESDWPLQAASAESNSGAPPRLIRASARFTSPLRDSVDISVHFNGVEVSTRRNDFAEPMSDLAPDLAMHEAIGSIIAGSVRNLYDRESRMAIAHGNPAAALWLSDRARTIGVPSRDGAACLGDAVGKSPAEMGARLVRCIPAGVTVVHQDLDASKLYTWVIRDGKMTFTKTSMSATRLEAQIEHFRELLEKASGNGHLIAGRHLFDILLASVREQIAGNGVLVFSPSGILRDVPFAVLRDGDRYLIENRAVLVTPTLSLLTAWRKLKGSASALVLLPPPAEGRPALRGASREVREVAGIYGKRGTLLAGAAVTPELFLRSVASFDIIHIATHGENSDLPYQNAIEFGPNRIRAYDVFALDLRRAPVVMLAACRTAQGSQTNMSLTDAFLAAGASAVVGALWDVEDGAAAWLSAAFHRELARGVSPYEALRNAQVLAIQDKIPPADWAAFQVNS